MADENNSDCTGKSQQQSDSQTDESNLAAGIALMSSIISYLGPENVTEYSVKFDDNDQASSSSEDDSETSFLKLFSASGGPGARSRNTRILSNPEPMRSTGNVEQSQLTMINIRKILDGVLLSATTLRIISYRKYRPLHRRMHKSLKVRINKRYQSTTKMGMIIVNRTGYPPYSSIWSPD